MGPYNPLEQQLSYNPDTGEVTEWKLKPYNKVDEIAAYNYHNICYDMGKNKGGEMPKWGQTARFLINTKQKLGLGLPLSTSWQLADELHKPITRNFSKRAVISNGIDEIWAADLLEMQKLSKWNKLKVWNIYWW